MNKYNSVEIIKLYQTLRNHDALKDKVKLSKCESGIVIEFHEYLFITISDDMFEFNKALWHCHPNDNDEILEMLTEMMDEVYIENSFWHSLRTLSKSKFEKRQEKLMRKKRVRIYTTHEILKYSR